MMNELLESICRSAGKVAGVIVAFSSMGGPLYYNEDWERRTLQHEIQEIQAHTEGTLHYVPWVNLFQGSVIPDRKQCEENPQNKKYDCQLSFHDVNIPVAYSPKTVAMLSRFDEAAALKQTCFLSATPTLCGLELTSLSCQKTRKSGR